jgi:hypothetical protein
LTLWVTAAAEIRDTELIVRVSPIPTVIDPPQARLPLTDLIVGRLAQVTFPVVAFFENRYGG